MGRYRGADGFCVAVPYEVETMAVPRPVAMLAESDDVGVARIGVIEDLRKQLYEGDDAAFVLFDRAGQLMVGHGEVWGRRGRLVLAEAGHGRHPVLRPGPVIVSVPDLVMHPDV